jgi:hypothetical protein
VRRFDLESPISTCTPDQNGNTRLTRSHRLLKVLDSLLLAGIIGALLVVKPTELLKHFGVIWITFQNATVGTFGCFELEKRLAAIWQARTCTYLFLLFVNMSNLEPDVFFGQRARWIGDNVFEALV